MKSNNFDFLRFLFALLVVIAHSYPLSGNNVSTQWVYKLTNGQVELSGIGLYGFFTISGYLIFLSLKRSSSFFEYYWKRILRLFPALIVLLLLTIFLAPLVYENTTPYFKNLKIYSYFFRNLTLYRLQYGIEGVFENNIYPNAINGSLWTIWYEFSLYVFLSFLFYIRKNKYFLQVLIVISFLLMYISYNFLLHKFSTRMIFGLNGLHFLNLGTYFVAGSLLAIFNYDKRVNSYLIWGLLFILIATLYFDVYTYAKHLIFPLIVLAIGLKPIKFISSFGEKGDPSYGIYIYSFPIQQTLMYFFGLTTFYLIIWSVLISVLFGYFSWYLVEKKALSYKKHFKKIIH